MSENYYIEYYKILDKLLSLRSLQIWNTARETDIQMFHDMTGGSQICELSNIYPGMNRAMPIYAIVTESTSNDDLRYGFIFPFGIGHATQFRSQGTLKFSEINWQFSYDVNLGNRDVPHGVELVESYEDIKNRFAEFGDDQTLQSFYQTCEFYSNKITEFLDYSYQKNIQIDELKPHELFEKIFLNTGGTVTYEEL